jgi:hypothetical protein
MKTSKAEPRHLIAPIHRTQLPLTKTTAAPFHLPFHTTDHQHIHGLTMGHGKRKTPFTKTHPERLSLGPTEYTKTVPADGR